MPKHIIEPIIVEVKPSKILKGEIGLFATRSLQRNTIIAEAKKFVDVFHPWGDFKKLDKYTKRKINQFWALSENLWKRAF
jgi:hypothetical protein